MVLSSVPLSAIAGITADPSNWIYLKFYPWDSNEFLSKSRRPDKPSRKYPSQIQRMLMIAERTYLVFWHKVAVKK